MTSMNIAATPGAKTGGLRGVFSRIRASMAQRRICNQTIKQLSALSDRELNDIGLSRGDIRRVAARPAG